MQPKQMYTHMHARTQNEMHALTHSHTCALT